MTFIIVENLRGFFNSRPPLVVFMICLASFAIALITFAYIVKTRDLPNPDVTEDWNTFLEKLSHLKFCVSHNTTSHNWSTPAVKVGDLSPADALESIKDKLVVGKVPEALSVSTRTLSEDQPLTGGLRVSLDPKERTDPPSPIDDTTWAQVMDPGSRDGRINETFHLNIEFVPNHEFVTSNFKSVYLITEVSGSLLSMKGKRAEQNIVMTVSFPTSNSEDNCMQKRGSVCLMYLINACVTFSGPASLLPRARHGQLTTTCPSEAPSHAGSLVRSMSANLLTGSGQKWCSHGASVAVEYSFDDSLTVLLSQEDRSVINLHLMRTSYFLFVMVVTLFCYAAIKGRPGKVKVVVYPPHEKGKVTLQSSSSQAQTQLNTPAHTHMLSHYYFVLNFL
ncbi:unnamed protein product [Candidula unifasciata]|uniref:TMEM248/TMEM219 domain-containing protein n=1 Tax=Candidula unifasciata TaxID=100452 RepID=A0A8S3ZM66_9EUPU|nr:unnamed protein product [Candidula unifasciata]